MIREKVFSSTRYRLQTYTHRACELLLTSCFGADEWLPEKIYLPYKYTVILGMSCMPESFIGRLEIEDPSRGYLKIIGILLS